jgi:predicted ATP-dependent serine protease
MNRKPMSEEAKAKIAESVRLAFEKKRLAAGVQTSVPEVLTVIPETLKMQDLIFDPKLFEPIKSGKAIDTLLSSDGGFPRATNFMMIGDPGVGKSTVAMDILSDLQLSGASVLFISAEMDRIDLYGYVKRYPKFGTLDILFLGEYLDQNPKLVVEHMLRKGYDIVLIDSFVEVQDTVKEANGMSTGGTEKWLIDLMRQNNAGQNDRSIYTSFLCIQQVTKGGTFVGSNKLKHNTTGMMELRFEEDGTRYIMFTKNRRGEVNKRMFFDLSATGDVKYDSARYDLDEAAREILGQEKENLKTEGEGFDSIFGTVAQDIQDTEND